MSRGLSGEECSRPRDGLGQGLACVQTREEGGTGSDEQGEDSRREG